MNRYTYENVIYNPKSEEANNCLNKVVFFSDSPTACLYHANNKDARHCGILQSIKVGDSFPFVIVNLTDCSTYVTCNIIPLKEETDEYYYFSCIIPKKEEPEPEYVPFDNIEELIEASLEHNRSHSLSKVHGIWLKNKEDGTTSLITSINENTNYLYFNLRAESLEDIFCNYCFLDDTPCGKLQVVNNE